jgi:hypothetical protein
VVDGARSRHRSAIRWLVGDEFLLQPGAVHTWHFSDFAPCPPGIRNALKSGHRLNISTTLPANTPFQNLRAKRESKLTYLTAWIASFVRAPCL